MGGIILRKILNILWRDGTDTAQFTAVFTLCIHIPCYAYLDPGSGNALVYVIISFMGAFIFTLKGLFYKLLGKKVNTPIVEGQIGAYDKIVIFSEGKQYWMTFKPIVEALLERKACFSYYTMNVNDPCLEIDSPYMNNRYIGKGNMAYAKIGNLKAEVMLSTTPNIGTEGYPIPRSKNVKNLVHVLHSYDGIESYHIGSLDHYDTVFTVGSFETKVIRDLEKARGLKEKKLVPGGVPYLDELGRNKFITEKNEKEPMTLLLAPSWGGKGFLTEYGTDFIEKLAYAGYCLIIRPHPQSYRVEQQLLKEVHSKLDKFNNIEWDDNLDGTRSMARADVMISDTSGVRMDFMLIYNRPVISLNIPTSSMTEFEGVYMQEIWWERQIDKYGSRLDHNTIDTIIDVVESIKGSDKINELLKFRDENLYNYMSSGEVIADWLIKETSI